MPRKLCTLTFTDFRNDDHSWSLRVFRNVKREFNRIVHFMWTERQRNRIQRARSWYKLGLVGLWGNWSNKPSNKPLQFFFFSFRCFYIRLESLDFYFYFIANKDHQLLVIQLNAWIFSEKCFKYSKIWIMFLVLFSRF